MQNAMYLFLHILCSFVDFLLMHCNTDAQNHVKAIIISIIMFSLTDSHVVMGDKQITNTFDSCCFFVVLFPAPAHGSSREHSARLGEKPACLCRSPGGE